MGRSALSDIQPVLKLSVTYQLNSHMFFMPTIELEWRGVDLEELKQQKEEKKAAKAGTTATCY